jgi:hypothetical protein
LQAKSRVDKFGKLKVFPERQVYKLGAKKGMTAEE